jgi:hypothetical protein
MQVLNRTDESGGAADESSLTAERLNVINFSNTIDTSKT